VRNPKLILVGEASLGLAPLVVEAILEFLETLARSGTSLLIVDQFVTRAMGRGVEGPRAAAGRDGVLGLRLRAPRQQRVRAARRRALICRAVGWWTVATRPGQTS
jgi:ABC-type branched-subunit amino acid transport system ATPase component